MNKFEKGLLTIFFVELFVGGGGRLIDFGFLSIRQVLFLLLILTFIVRIIRTKAIFDRDVNTFFRLNAVSIGVYALLFWFVVSAVIGFVNGHALSIIVMDFFRVSFFAVYFPLAYYISEQRFPKEKITTMIKYSACVVAIFTIVIALLGKTVFSSNFAPYYLFLNDVMNDDLLFRPSHSVFYKSHFFVLIGLILSLNSVLTKKFKLVDILNIILCFISIFWSETRGLFVALMVSVLMIVILDVKVIVDPIKGLAAKIKTAFQNSQLVKKSIILILITISVPLLYQHMTLERFGDSSTATQQQTQKNSSKSDAKDKKKQQINDTSVNARVEFMIAAKDMLLSKPVQLVFGYGYGTEIAGRDMGIEMSFLDILVEQGLIGLAIWLYLCLIVFLNYLWGYKRGAELSTTDRSLIGVFLGVLLLTNINPFINNPIGIVFFIMMLVLSQNLKECSGRLR